MMCLPPGVRTAAADNAQASSFLACIWPFMTDCPRKGRSATPVVYTITVAPTIARAIQAVMRPRPIRVMHPLPSTPPPESTRDGNIR